MSSTPADAADEAGGEAVFSSDGLPPIPAPRPPSVPIPEKTGDDVLDSGDGVGATQAFEVFSGKVYAPSLTGRSVVTRYTETPLERLARLKEEVAQLEKDLDSDAAATPEELTLAASELAARVEAASSNNNTQQGRLTQSLQKQVEGWKAKRWTHDDQDEDKPEGIVYELYGAPSTDGGPPTSSAEERLCKLEQILGSSEAGSSKTFFARLDEVEKMIKSVEPKSLEEAATRAKVIRADLEAASKARAKLSTTGSTSTEDAKKIDELYNLMIQLEGVSDHLPALVTRLQELASLHKQTGTFSARLTAAEQAAGASQQTLKNLEETLTQLEAGMGDNLKTMEQNMLDLDDRMKKL